VCIKIVDPDRRPQLTHALYMHLWRRNTQGELCWGCNGDVKGGITADRYNSTCVNKFMNKVVSVLYPCWRVGSYLHTHVLKIRSHSSVRILFSFPLDECLLSHLSYLGSKC
jgi:hypothetical protein